MSKQGFYNKELKKIDEDNTFEILEKIQKCQNEISSFRSKCDKDIYDIEKKYINTVKPHIKDRNFLILNIPQFWAKTLLNHPLLNTVFEPGEEKVLEKLANIDLEEDPENPDYFKIHFIFLPNPYFENRILTKQFTEEGSASTNIDWKTDDVFPKETKHEVWEYDELGLELKGFFRWFSDPEEQFCDPIADILKCQIWQNPLEFYFEDLENGRTVQAR